MKKVKIIITGMLMLSLVLVAALSGCSSGDTSKLEVVTSTSLITLLVERVGGDAVDVVNIIPPAQCPGHFDVKPSDIRKLADADLFIMHGWQGEKFSGDLIASANNSNLAVFKIDIKGNWMTPPIQLEATDKITDSLCQVDTENCSEYQELAARYKARVESKEAELKAKLGQADISGINVLCADKQAGFIKWVGLNIVGTFGRPDSLTPQVVKELVDKGREANVTLIVDNLQSGRDAGAGIAEELGCKRIILSNFPGGFDDTQTWEKAIDHNVDLILNVMAK